ncbi:hypothetical protein QPK32_23965 [Massilia sp. YIM B02763]|uniref:hypothetical protein n=1 Tax=Massilia sp. YIM B02763 TaxID=3050130 RepID=UPI0025B6AA42|nr:hypothetical protein [Massilia sp. YIM B02763]MDN4056125.1 hypothetical protein [Massilia sp. YIM B02763]
MNAGATAVWNGAPDASRRRLALGFTCAFHLLALLLFLRQQARPPDTHAPEVVGVLLQLPAPALVPRAPASSPPPAPVPRRKAVPATAPAIHAPVADTPAAPPAQPDAAPAEEAPAAAPAADGAPAGGFAMGLARRQAGRADRELRNGKSGVPLEADTPWARFRRGLEAAHIDDSRTLATDTYTSPDGVIYYRYRQGNRVRCRRSGGVGVLPQSMAEAGSAANVPCPSGASWQRD